MMQQKIKLRVDEVEEFVRMASKYEFDIDIAYNRYTVDAKSIVGVLGMDFRQILTVTCSEYNAEFSNYLKGFAVAC